MRKAQPNKGEGGRVYADSDGGWYYIVDLLENGDEKRVLSSNALFHIQDAATRFSTETPGFTNTVFIVDGRTHAAIALYEKDKGLREDWNGEDPQKAEARRKAYESGQSLISHRQE